MASPVRLAGVRHHTGPDVAGDLAAGHWHEPLVEFGAAVHSDRASRVEAAAGRRIRRVGHVTGQVDWQHAGAIGVRDRGHERLGVRVLRIRPHGLGRADLHDPAQVHHRDAVGDLADDRQIVGDQDQAKVGVLDQLTQQVGHLGLSRCVQRADGLVGNQARRPGR